MSGQLNAPSAQLLSDADPAEADPTFATKETFKFFTRASECGFATHQNHAFANRNTVPSTCTP